MSLRAGGSGAAGLEFLLHDWKLKAGWWSCRAFWGLWAWGR